MLNIPYSVTAIPALLLLFYPLDALLPVGVEPRSCEEILSAREEIGLRPWRWLLLWLVDPMRSFTGAFVLKLVFASNSGTRPVVFWLALGSGVVLQAWTNRAPMVAWAPIGFCAGILVAVLPPSCAFVGIVVAGAATLYVRTWSVFFLMGIIYLLPLALFESIRTACLGSSFLLVLPLCMRVLFNTRLVLPSRW